MFFSTSLFSAPLARCGIVCDHRHFPPFSSPCPPPFPRRLNWCWSGYSAVGLYERGNGKPGQEAGSRRRRGQETGKSGKTGRATYETYRLLYFASGHCPVFLLFFPVSQGICGKFNSNSFATALRFFEDSQVEYIIDWDSGCSGNRVS